MTAAFEFAGACSELFEAKKAEPTDDILSHYATATIDGCPLDETDVIADALLLLDGGAETTRTVIARTIVNLIQEPAELEKLRAGCDLAVAVEEFIRYVTPVHNMCRVASSDTSVAGMSIPKGDQVLLMYASANRDSRGSMIPIATT